MKSFRICGGTPLRGREVVQLTVVDVAARCPDRPLPALESLLVGVRREGEVVSHAQRPVRPRPRRVVRPIVLEARHYSHNSAEIAEQCYPRLYLGPLKRRQPVFAVDFEVHELDERRSADAGKPTASGDRDLAVPDFHQATAHADDLLPVGVEVHLAEEKDCISRRVGTRCHSDPSYRYSSGAGIESDRRITALIQVVLIAIRRERMDCQTAASGVYNLVWVVCRRYAELKAVSIECRHGPAAEEAH